MYTKLDFQKPCTTSFEFHCCQKRNDWKLHKKKVKKNEGKDKYLTVDVDWRLSPTACSSFTTTISATGTSSICDLEIVGVGWGSMWTAGLRSTAVGIVFQLCFSCWWCRPKAVTNDMQLIADDKFSDWYLIYLGLRHCWCRPSITRDHSVTQLRHERFQLRHSGTPLRHEDHVMEWSVTEWCFITIYTFQRLPYTRLIQMVNRLLLALKVAFNVRNEMQIYSYLFIQWIVRSGAK